MSLTRAGRITLGFGNGYWQAQGRHGDRQRGGGRGHRARSGDQMIALAQFLGRGAGGHRNHAIQTSRSRPIPTSSRRASASRLCIAARPYAGRQFRSGWTKRET